MALRITLVVVAYLAGSLPFGLWIARLKGVDLRQVGSGNIGATNAARALGKRWAALVLLLDALKGFLPTWLASHLLVGNPDYYWWVGATMVAAVFGHTHSVLLRFRGGKGVATGLGVTLAVVPALSLFGVIAYALAFAYRRISSIGSLTALAAVVTGAVFFCHERPILWAILLVAALITLRHRENIRRLIRREEH